MGQVDSVRSARITGLEETVRGLQQWDKDALKIMNKEIYQVMKKIQVDARQLMPETTPLSKWGMSPKEGSKWGRLQFVAKDARMGLKTKIERQRRKGTWTSKAYLMINADPAGAIYETAGRKNPRGTSPQGAAFIKGIARESGLIVRGKQGRVAYKAVQDREAYTLNEIRDAIIKGEAALNRKLAK